MEESIKKPTEDSKEQKSPTHPIFIFSIQREGRVSLYEVKQDHTYNLPFYVNISTEETIDDETLGDLRKVNLLKLTDHLIKRLGKEMKPLTSELRKDFNKAKHIMYLQKPNLRGTYLPEAKKSYVGLVLSRAHSEFENISRAIPESREVYRHPIVLFDNLENIVDRVQEKGEEFQVYFVKNPKYRSIE